MQLEITAHGEKVVARRLDRLAGRAVEARPAFEAIGTTLRGYEKRLFDSEGASGGAPWTHLEEATVMAKAHHEPPLDPRILHATGRLRRSLSEAHAPGHLEHATHTSLTFGSLVLYSGYHQRGRGVPRRRPLQYTENQKRYIVRKLQTFIFAGHT
jgi:Phage virion morphogenesis family